MSNLQGTEYYEATPFGNLYLGNGMTGHPYFNAPWFDTTAAELRKVAREVFNPAEQDRLMGFEPMDCPNGTVEESVAAGFDLHRALGTDWDYIAHRSDGLVIGPDWVTSKGTISEIACHQALGKPVWEWKHFQQLMEGLRHRHVYSSAWQFPQLSALLG